MISYDELNRQNHEITELTNVLSYLLKDRQMCDTSICCDLLYRYADRIKAHLDMVDRTYSALLSNPDNKINNVARSFMSGSQEIRKIFSTYSKQWCAKNRHELRINDHGDFIKDTDRMFELVLGRIQDETEHLYPLIREIRGDHQHAA